jgi:hypothetical protein
MRRMNEASGAKAASDSRATIDEREPGSTLASDHSTSHMNLGCLLQCCCSSIKQQQQQRKQHNCCQWRLFTLHLIFVTPKGYTN